MGLVTRESAVGTTAAPGADGVLASLRAGLDRGEVPLRLYNDPDVYARELERVFARCWVFVGHASEIPNAGDFVRRYVGEDAWILVRDDAGDIRVLFDSCRHRGSQVCPADAGNTTHFRCPYHGWAYNTRGALVGVPNRDRAYKTLDAAAWGLLQAPQVDTYRGLIFACLDPATPPLADYLGDYRWYLDLHFGLTPGGMEVLGEPHRWRIAADWKSGAENFAGDSYHTQTLHRSLLSLDITPLAPPTPLGGRTARHVHVTECSGHASSIRQGGEGEPGCWGYPPEVVAAFTWPGLSADQIAVARATINTTGTIFPNLSLIHTGVSDARGRPPATFLSLRQWQPRGPGQMEIWSWVLAPAEASAAYKARAYKVAVASFSPSGNFEQDDTIVWSGIARAARSVFVAQSGAMLNYQMGLDGMSDARPLADWPGPGVVYDANLEEGVQRTFLRRWLAEMTRA